MMALQKNEVLERELQQVKLRERHTQMVRRNLKSLFGAVLRLLGVVETSYTENNLKSYTVHFTCIER